MSLAYIHSVGDTPNPAVARAYAEGALAMVPDWHYVKDILLPKIEKLAEPPAPKTSQAQPRCTPEESAARSQ